MTFEQFFLKKKIDLDLLRLGKPDIFAEFVAHFEVMSEKSFDHTKKYWFNNLRIAYPLSEEKESLLKEAFKPKLESPVENETAQQAEKSVALSSIKGPSFKPRFKAGQASASPKIEEAKVEPIKEEALAEEKPVAAKPAGFKPRFKALRKEEES